MLLAWLAAIFVSGVVVGSWLELPPTLLLGCSVVAAASLGFRRASRWRMCCLAVSIFLLGCARGQSPSDAARPGDLAFYNGRYAVVLGAVSQEPDIRDTAANYVVSASRVTIGGKALAVSGNVEVHLPLSQELAYGHEVSLTGWLREPSRRGSFDYRAVLARRGIYSTMEFVRVQDLGPRSTGFSGWIQSIRNDIEQNIDIWVPEPEASLLIAITLGSHSAALGGLVPALVGTGLIHIIAISGIKVAMVAGTMHEIARLVRRRLLTLIVSLLTLAAYVLLTGSTVSGVRSASMWALVFLATYLGRTTVSLVSLSIAAAIMVAMQPYVIGDIGFQLSTVGTFAIVSLTPPLLRTFRPVPSPLRESLCVTIAAQIGTLPIVAIGFGQVSVVGPVANALVLPLLPLLIACGFALGAVGPILLVAPLLGAFSDSLLRLVVNLAVHLNQVPSVRVSAAVAPLAVLVYFATLAVGSSWLLRRSHWAPAGQWSSRGRELLLAALVGLIVLTASVTVARGSTGTRVTWLGSGEAILVVSPRHVVLIDGSPHPLTLLRRIGSQLSGTRRTIDLVMVTDPSAANVVGLRAVLARYSVREVLDVGTEYPSTTYASWRRALRLRHIPDRGLRIGTGASFDGLAIQAVSPYGPCYRPRDCVAILRIDASAHHLLLLGASDSEDQREVLFTGQPLFPGTVVSTSGHSVQTDLLQALGRHVHVWTVRGVAPPHARLLDTSATLIEQW